LLLNCCDNIEINGQITQSCYETSNAPEVHSNKTCSSSQTHDINAQTNLSLKTPDKCIFEI